MADLLNTDGDNPKRTLVFVNHVDLYTGKNISKILKGSVVGATAEEDEVNDDESQASGQPQIPKENCYKVVGTLQDPTQHKPEWVDEVFEYNTKEDLLPHLLECDIIVYDITGSPDQVDEATWAVSALHAELENFNTLKVFICLSTVMTWARSKPLDPDDPEISFTEDDYRRRRAHPNFKSHISAEKLVIKHGKTNKSKFITYVVAAGLTYGSGEDIFHFLFKTAWHGQAPALQCFGNGQNIVPTIHIKDLAAVIVNICDQNPKVRYLVAVDESKNTLEEIVKAVSAHLGNGRVKNITKEEALLIKELEQADFDLLLVNLRMDATYIKEGMNIIWVSESGLAENIDDVIKEYKETRGLLPLRACIMGPPASGKTLVIKQLCEHYKLHHIKIQDAIDEAVDKLQRSAARAEAEEDDEDDLKAQEDQEFLETLQDSRDRNSGRYEDQYIIRFYKDKLHSMPCQNQGFILDGYPKTYEQAKELFAAEEGEEGEEDSPINYDKQIMPEVVVSLDAPDEFLKTRVMNLPESVVAGTHNTEEGLMRRLAEFRASNTEDETVLNYFDELEIHPDHIDITQDKTRKMTKVVEQIKKLMGKPRNYGPTPDELAEMERIETEKRLQKERKAREEREKRDAEEAAERQRREEEWRVRLSEVKRQEQELLENQSIPLRNYLMKHVMPTLAQGLIECCKMRPDDPVDYLAEYLFKNNPQID
ncbi:adenylate kinase 7-like [Stylophora pistillata]|uniref:Adenylate kinase 7 n=1 Tax=Stylophora pistillata TaxID=50429 RepID=A0A2B4SEE2_STYPI|nr:adenylate kinase 7-like [Stylophora pistillata]PFX27190.1 Adenylate kinase 7 [Stylophora pistillata]